MVQRRALLVSGVVAGGVAMYSDRGRRAVRQAFRLAARQARYLAGRSEGLVYRLSGAHPDLDVDDRTLADRIRSELGTLEMRLDIPRVHVMVEGHVALLHGVVGSQAEAEEIEQAVGMLSGVKGVKSYLHVGLLGGDTRPSEGRGFHPPSEALVRLLSAARDSGADEDTDRPAVRAVLGTLAERLPAHERGQLFSHFPEDVRALAEPARGSRHAGQGPRHVDEFVAATGVDVIEPGKAASIVESVLGTLRGLVPEEATGMSAVLPAELKELLWQSAVP